MYHQIPIALMDDWDDSEQCKIPDRVPLIFLKHNDRYLNIADKSFNGSQEVNITKNEMISWLELDSSIIFVGVTTTPLSHGSHTTTIHKESANADITVTENTLAIYDGREYLFVNGSWQMLGVKIDKLVFTPEGSVNAHNFTPSGTLNMNDFTPSGTISTPTFTGTKVT